jgi:hypothetical protein
VKIFIDQTLEGEIVIKFHSITAMQLMIKVYDFILDNLIRIRQNYNLFQVSIRFGKYWV